MLPIRQTINALACLNRTDKAVLIEVCQLAERGEQGWCTAQNDYLIGALASSLRTITRRLALLKARGLLLIQGEGKARRLAPAPGLRACYAGADEPARQSSIANLANLATSGAEPSHFSPANLATLAPEPSQSGEVEPSQPSHNGYTNLATSGAEPSHFGSRVYGDQVNQDSTSTPTPGAWAGERETLQKKIAHLETENLRLKAKIQELVPPVAAPPRQLATPPPNEVPGPRYSDAAKALAAEVAPVWSINRIRGGGLWMQLTRFCHVMEQAGRLDEARRQFTGYAAYRQKRSNIEPMSLTRFLGSEGGGYVGEWCQVEWPDKAVKARADGDKTPAAPTRAPVNLKQAVTDQQQVVM